MKTHRVTNLQIAENLGRNDGYVSERARGLRPIDTDDVDALAALVDGWSGRALMIELARRTRETQARPDADILRPDFRRDVADDPAAAASDSADTTENDDTDEHFFE